MLASQISALAAEKFALVGSGHSGVESSTSLLAETLPKQLHFRALGGLLEANATLILFCLKPRNPPEKSD